jgi:hypothetical protein
MAKYMWTEIYWAVWVSKFIANGGLMCIKKMYLTWQLEEYTLSKAISVLNITTDTHPSMPYVGRIIKTWTSSGTQSRYIREVQRDHELGCQDVSEMSWGKHLMHLWRPRGCGPNLNPPQT